MSGDIENLHVYMIREDREDIPAFELPSPFGFRWYRPGDRDVWVHIQHVADKYTDVTPELFDESNLLEESTVYSSLFFCLDNAYEYSATHKPKRPISIGSSPEAPCSRSPIVRPRPAIPRGRAC